MSASASTSMSNMNVQENSQFTLNKNIKMLWDVIKQDPVLASRSNAHDSLYTLFVKDLNKFYNEQGHAHSSLMQLNKIFIIQELAAQRDYIATIPLRDTDTIHESLSPIPIDRTNKLTSFETQMALKQQEVDELNSKLAPKVATPLKETRADERPSVKDMDALLANALALRTKETPETKPVNSNNETSPIPIPIPTPTLSNSIIGEFEGQRSDTASLSIEDNVSGNRKTYQNDHGANNSREIKMIHEEISSLKAELGVLRDTIRSEIYKLRMEMKISGTVMSMMNTNKINTDKFQNTEIHSD